jgi:Domain of unknown function (DUF4288)
MNWYLTKLVFRIICGEGHHTPQFDEQLRLISATDENQAFEKATAIGTREQDDFYNQERQLVQWKFINVAELYKLSGLLDGAEMYSRIQETDDPENYIDGIHRRAENIRDSSTHKMLRLL